MRTFLVLVNSVLSDDLEFFDDIELLEELAVFLISVDVEKADPVPVEQHCLDKMRYLRIASVLVDLVHKDPSVLSLARPLLQGPSRVRAEVGVGDDVVQKLSACDVFCCVV